MKKRFLGLAVAGAVLASATLASCGDQDVFHIYCWNNEFQGFFNKYISDEKSADAETYHLDGKVVKWTQVTSDNGAYQKALDTALQNNKNASKSEKVDMFLAEADYIVKYADSKFTTNVDSLVEGKTLDQSNTYAYTRQAASDASGVIKGVSFQCCPSGMIYRTDIAEAVLGTSDPAAVQKKVATWADFDAVAAKMQEKGYLMTGSYADTYRVFSNNAATPWVDANKKLTIPTAVQTWITQADEYVSKGYTKTEGVWDAGKTAEFTANGKAFCTFGPAWYYNFCMETAQKGEAVVLTDAELAGATQDDDKNYVKDGKKIADKDKNKLDDSGNKVFKEGTSTFGKWRVIKGPQAHFWGGTWAMAAANGDDNELVYKVMEACLSSSFSKNLLENESQFSNNKLENSNYAGKSTGNAFLGNQNDTNIWVGMAGDIQFKNNTIYDQQCNEGLQTEYVKYLKKTAAERTPEAKTAAIKAFYSYIKTQFPAVTTD